MSTLPTNPDSGFHYVHVIPDVWGPFVDVHACYEYAARQLGWVSVIAPRETEENPFWADPEVIFIYWENGPVPIERRARTALIYSEALDEDNGVMLPAHVAHWNKLAATLHSFDMLLGHTPEMAERLGRFTDKPTGVMPVGWEPAAMGGPRRTSKRHRLVYHGSPSGRRQLIMPYLRGALGDNLIDASGQFGRSLLGTMDAARATLYIAHSLVRSWSTWRIWQAVATGCAIVGDPGDCWPLSPDLVITIAPITAENAEEVADQLHQIANQDDRLHANGDAIYNLLGEWFTTTECHWNYLVPATRQLQP